MGSKGYPSYPLQVPSDKDEELSQPVKTLFHLVTLKIRFLHLLYDFV